MFERDFVPHVFDGGGVRAVTSEDVLSTPKHLDILWLKNGTKE